MSHTPGPWDYIVDDRGINRDIVVTDHRGDILCDIGGGLFKTRQANAALMSAAPDLLAALKAVAPLLEADGYVAIDQIVRAAIAKAEGKS
jgi:hypothetical protein